MNKKGISAIIVTILLILLALALILLIWFFFRNNLLKSGGQVDASVLLVRLTIPPESVKVNSSDISLIVKRQEGLGMMSAFVIVLEDIYGNKGVFRYNESLQELQAISKTIPYSVALANLTQACVVPFVLNKDGYELQGKQEDCYTISFSGSGIVTPPPVIPTINPPASFIANTLSWEVIGLTWNDNSNEENYSLESSTDGAGYTVLETLPKDTTSYTHLGLIPSTAHYYRIRAFNSSIGYSTYSVTSGVTNAFVFPTNSLSGYWKFDASEGAAFDSVGNNDGYTNNGANTFTAGKLGRAGNFDGTNDQINITNHSFMSGLTSGSISMWVKWNGIQSYGNGFYGSVFGRQFHNVGSDMVLGLDSADPAAAKVKFSLYLGREVVGTTIVGDGAWKFITATFNYTSESIYVNGVLENTVNHDPYTANTLTTYIGAWGEDGASYSRSLIDEVALWNKTLSSAEVLDMWNGNYGKALIGNESGLVALYHMDELSWTGISDSSTYANNGQYSGGIPDFVSGRNAHGQAINLDGIDDYIGLPSSSAYIGAGSFTWSLWFRGRNLPTSNVVDRAQTFIITADGSPCDDTYFGFGSEQYAQKRELAFNVDQSGGCGARDNALNYYPTGGFVNDQWYHVVAVRDYSTQKTSIYLDGELVANKTRSGTYLSGSRPGFIGVWADTLNKFAYFNGTLDEVSMWNRALNASEVKGLYYCQLNNNCA